MTLVAFRSTLRYHGGVELDDGTVLALVAESSPTDTDVGLVLDELRSLGRQRRALKREIDSEEAEATIIDRALAILGGLTGGGAALLAPIAAGAAMGLTVAASGLIAVVTARWFFRSQTRRLVSSAIGAIDDRREAVLDEHMSRLRTVDARHALAGANAPKGELDEGEPRQAGLPAGSEP